MAKDKREEKLIFVSNGDDFFAFAKETHSHRDLTIEGAAQERGGAEVVSFEFLVELTPLGPRLKMQYKAGRKLSKLTYEPAGQPVETSAAVREDE